MGLAGKVDTISANNSTISDNMQKVFDSGKREGIAENETTLDAIIAEQEEIIALQNQLIGGDSE